MRLIPLTTTGEQLIPGNWSTGGPGFVAKEIRTYVLSLEQLGKHVQFYFKSRPRNPDPSGDNPLTVRIPRDCTVVFKLDRQWDWEFRHDNAITLSDKPHYPKEQRYANLKPTIQKSRCYKVAFDARRLTENDYTNRDQFNLYLQLDQILPKANRSTPLQLPIRLDPDIQNPGDPPPNTWGSGHKKTKKKVRAHIRESKARSRR